MPHIIRRSRKIITTETWTIVWSEGGNSESDEMPAELPSPDRSPALPEPSAADDTERPDQLTGS
jgi:hypothetical protein